MSKEGTECPGNALAMRDRASAPRPKDEGKRENAGSATMRTGSEATQDAP
ncbi:hypothetical protein J4G37_08405 [Microvirga sp. 3-52]|nr:hypothetical protein [Microvirga sp. 3-52]